MGISMAEIANDEATVTFQHKGKDVTITYYPGRVTEEVFAVSEVISGADDPSGIVAGFKNFNEMLADLMKSWNVYEDLEETTLFPIDASRFAKVPLGFRMECFYAVIGDIRPETMAPEMMR